MTKPITEGDWKRGVLEISEDGIKPIAPPPSVQKSGIIWFSEKTRPKSNREILMYFGDGIIISGEYCDGLFSVYGMNDYRSCEVLAWAEMISTPTQYGISKVGR